MKNSIFALPLLISLIASYGGLVYAETTFEIVMPSGASDPDAPFFWKEKTTGVTSGEITIFPNDSVIWKNADTAFHTITSVTQAGEIDGKFDSGFINAGDSFEMQFTELGDNYYFCSLHPWMSGIVHVVKNPGSVQSIHNVGSGFSEDGLGFEVKYILDTNLQKAVFVDPDNKSLTFRISGNSENDQITIVLPTELIENPNTALVNDKVTNFESEVTSSGTKLVIPISSDSTEITILGSKVIPEFGILAFSILSISIVTTLFFTRSKLSIFS